MPIVSVVVPNYNHARYLPRRLESILGQTITDFELIFLDDASTDDSLAVFERYAGDPRIRSLLNDTNSGSPFKQWNRGIATAKGKYVWIAESDDFCNLDFLETLLPHLEVDGACGMVFCRSHFVDADDRITGTYTCNQFSDSARWESDFRANGPEILRRYLTITNVIPNASAVVFRTDLARLVGSASEGMRLAGDWMFWAKLLSQSDLCYVAQPLNYFRDMHTQSQRFREMRAGLEIIEGVDVCEFIEQVVGLTQLDKRNILASKIRHWMYVRGTRQLDSETDVRILARFEAFAAGLYGDSPSMVKCQVLVRAAMYKLIQQPLLKHTLVKVWYKLQGRRAAARLRREKTSNA